MNKEIQKRLPQKEIQKSLQEKRKEKRPDQNHQRIRDKKPVEIKQKTRKIDKTIKRFHLSEKLKS